MKKTLICAMLLGATVLPALQGCFPIVAAGVTTGVLAAVDRRTVGSQTEDETIEWKASARVDEKLRDRGHFNFVSYNMKVLITGEAQSEEVRSEVEHLVSQVTNVQGVYNEIAVMPSSSLADRSNDAYITSKVKARLVDSGKVSAVHVKVYTERGNVYLLGLLTPAETDAAVHVARTTSGVRKVVNLTESITPTRARELDGNRSNNRNNPAPVESRVN